VVRFSQAKKKTKTTRDVEVVHPPPLALFYAQSVANHERGKKHQENVQLRLKEVRGLRAETWTC
jgi:hypothetical protein